MNYLKKPNKIKRSVVEGGLRIEGHVKNSSNDMPLVSAITVVFNNQKTIERCINSVLNQTYPCVEYIIMDGGSTDGTLDKIIRYKKHIDYFVSEADSGIYNAMNKGITLSRGEYIIFLNSDDWYSKHAIRSLVNAAIQGDADIAHADAYVVDENGKVISIIKAWLHDGIYTEGMPLRHETMLVKKSTYIKYGVYNENYEIIADYDLAIRFYSKKCRFVHVPKALLYFGLTGISNVNHPVRQEERKRLFADFFPFLDECDLRKLSIGATKQQRMDMVQKYKNRSELFERSMLCNIEQREQSRKTALIRKIKWIMLEAKLGFLVNIVEAAILSWKTKVASSFYRPFEPDQ